METIDVHDLPEEQAQLVAAFVAFLRQHQPHRDESAATALEPIFGAWPLGAKGTLSREDIYEHL